MIQLSVNKGLAIIFKRVLRPNFNKTISIFIKEKTRLTVDSGESIYCTLDTMPSYRYLINFGMGFIHKTFDLANKKLNVKQFKELVPDLKIVYLGAYFHEVGHLVFTDMDSTKLGSLPDIEFKGKKIPQAQIVSTLFNILEDQVIEYSMKNKYKSRLERSGGVDPKSIGSILADMRRIVIGKMISAYVDVPNSIGSLFNYLLLRLSFPTTFLGTNSFYSAHVENKEYVSKFLHERDATKRIDIALEYWNWLLTTEIEIPTSDVDDMHDTIPTSGGRGLGKKPSKAPAGAGAGASAALDDVKKPDEKSGGEVEIPGANSEVEPVDTYDPNDEDVFGELNDVEFNWTIHTECIMKDLSIPIHLDKIKKVGESMASISEELAYYFTMLKERNKPDYFGHLQSGSCLDMPAIISGERLNIFKEKIEKNNDKITGVTLLCDNSGSMSGEKSNILQHGVIAMAQMMDRLGISFSVHAFSDVERAMNVTFTLKDYDDDFSDPIILNNFNLLSNRTLEDDMETAILPYHSFRGNRDGYHVEYLSRNIDKHNFDNKIMIIFSDGLPYEGEEIKTAIGRHPDIKYIGIGLCDSSVRKFYKDNKVFADIDSLKELPKYLGDLLTKILNN